MCKNTDRIAIAFALLLLFAFPALSDARMIVALKSADIQPYDEAIEGFGQSCGCDLRQITLSETGGQEALAQIREMRPSAVFTVGLDAFNLAKEIHGIPVIYSMVPRSVSYGSGQGASGVSMFISPQKRLSAMLEVFPSAKRIGVIYDARHSEAAIEEAESFCRSRGIELVAKRTSRPGDFPSLLEGMKDRIDLFWMLPDPTVVNPEAVKYLLLFSFKNRVPVFTFSRKYVELGATAGLYASPGDMGSQAGEISQRILSEKSDAPIRADVRKTVLAINRKIAGKLGIRIRNEALKRAEDVE